MDENESFATEWSLVTGVLLRYITRDKDVLRIGVSLLRIIRDRSALRAFFVIYRKGCTKVRHVSIHAGGGM